MSQACVHMSLVCAYFDNQASSHGLGRGVLACFLPLHKSKAEVYPVQ